MTDVREEVVPKGQAIWQSDEAKNYRCPFCKMWIFSQYEGTASPTVSCDPDAHRLRWVEK